jgi:hypothetical protein
MKASPKQGTRASQHPPVFKGIRRRLCLHYSLIAAAAFVCLQSLRYMHSIATPYTTISLKEEEILSQPPLPESDKLSSKEILRQPPLLKSVKLASNLLSVPYYVYEELLWLDNATLGGIPLQEAIEEDKVFSNPKHNEDYWFMKASLTHPMRTYNPAEAKLFVVPSLSNIIMHTSIYYTKEKICWRGICGRPLMAYIDKILGESPWFQRNAGADHLASVGYHGWFHPRFKGAEFKNMENCNVVGYCGGVKINFANRLFFQKLYVGTACPQSPEKTHDFTMVASLRPKDKRFRSRRNICDWMGVTNSANYSMPVCGFGQQCPTLSNSRFGFHVRGDSYGANRLADTLLSGTVPIFTMKEQYTTVPDWFDWDKISYFADVTNKTSFLASVDRILADKEGYKTRLQNVLDNRDLFDWRTEAPFDTYMYMLQSHLFPELRTTSTKYSALILPKANYTNAGVDRSNR